jgi:Protein of unknown function (DUF3631)/Domain of unknown function (DUF3854)
MLSEAHLKTLAASGISPEFAQARGYETITSLKRLEDLVIPLKQRRVPGLLIPGHRKDGTIAGYQYRPDQPPPPGVKEMKYVSPVRQSNYIDVPMGFGGLLSNAAVALWITEGAKKADCAAIHGLMCVSINGVWGWRGTDAQMNKRALGDWEDIALNGRDVVIAFDGDVQRKPEVREALSRLAGFLISKGASVRYLWLPDTGTKEAKTGLDDYLMTHSVEELQALVSDTPPSGQMAMPGQAAKVSQNGSQPREQPTVHVGPAVDGVQLFDDIAEYLERFVVYPSGWAVTAHAMWIGHAWLLDCWESSPRIAFLSPEPGSGKTRALEITEPLVPNPIHSVNVTPAYLFRKIAEDPRPTILYDEIDAVFGPKAKENEDIRALLNSGHRKGAMTGRCVIKGKAVETEELPSYCAIALAGLNDLPDTIASRSVLVRMRKRSPVEIVEPWRPRLNLPEALELADRLSRWAVQNRDRATDLWPEMPDGIEDRNADIWEALIAVAELAGGHWPKDARCSAVAAITDLSGEEPSLGTELLHDISKVFEAEDVCSVVTSDLIRKLKEMEESPWMSYGYGQSGLTARGLSRMLGRYGIRSKNIRCSNGVFKGYERSQFEDAWIRYGQTLKTSVPHARTAYPVHVPHEDVPRTRYEDLDDPVRHPVPDESAQVDNAVRENGDAVHPVRPIQDSSSLAATPLQQNPRAVCWKCLGSKEIEDQLCPACQREEDEDD